MFIIVTEKQSTYVTEKNRETTGIYKEEDGRRNRNSRKKTKQKTKKKFNLRKDLQ